MNEIDTTKTEVNTEKSREITTFHLKAGELLFSTGEENTSLFFVQSGKLLTFVNDKTRITPLAYIEKGQYLGEMSFFDGMPCSANVICVEDCILFKVCFAHLEQECPRWLITIANSISSKLRKAGELIRQKGIRRKNVQGVAPLSIDDQRFYYQALLTHQEQYPRGRQHEEG